MPWTQVCLHGVPDQRQLRGQSDAAEISGCLLRGHTSVDHAIQGMQSCPYKQAREMEPQIAPQGGQESSCIAVDVQSSSMEMKGANSTQVRIQCAASQDAAGMLILEA